MKAMKRMQDNEGEIFRLKRVRAEDATYSILFMVATEDVYTISKNRAVVDKSHDVNDCLMAFMTFRRATNYMAMNPSKRFRVEVAASSVDGLVETTEILTADEAKERFSYMLVCQSPYTFKTDGFWFEKP